MVERAKLIGKDSQIWIKAMRFPAGVEDEIYQACQAALNEGVTHIAAWSYYAVELLDTVLSERPAEVWRAVEKAFKALRGK